MARSPNSHGRGSGDRGDGGGSEDKYRKSLVVADAARKRASWRYIYAGVPIPEKLRYRAIEEYDRMVAANKRGEGTSADAATRGEGSSGGVRAPMRTPTNRLVICDEAPPQEDKAYALALTSTIAPEDFVPDDEVDRMVV